MPDAVRYEVIDADATASPVYEAVENALASTATQGGGGDVDEAGGGPSYEEFDRPTGNL